MKIGPETTLEMLAAIISEAQSEPGSAKDRYALVRETIRAATKKPPPRRR